MTLQKDSGAPLLTKTSTQLIECGEVALMLPWSLQHYILVSLVWQDAVQPTQRETWYTTQSQNLWPTLCLAWKMCWGSGGTEFVGMANKCLIKLEPTSGQLSPCCTLIGWLGTGDWIAQGQRVETNTSGKKTKKLMKWSLIIFCCAYRSVPFLVVSREVFQETDRRVAEIHSQTLCGERV